MIVKRFYSQHQEEESKSATLPDTEEGFKASTEL